MLPSLASCACGLLALTSVRSEAHAVPYHDPMRLDDANLVVIVAPVGNDNFRVESIELDEAAKTHVGDTLSLPKFQLSREQPYGPDVVAPFTPDTHILLYLRRGIDATHPMIVEFFWVQKLQEVALLRKQALEAIAMRDDWRQARATPDVHARVQAVFPFLDKYNREFSGEAQIELRKTGAVAGDFLAARLETMSPDTRTAVVVGAVGYKSEKLHLALLRHLANQQRQYEQYLAQHGPDEKKRVDDWSNAPRSTQDSYGELYSGLAGLADFTDRRDLPTIRNLAMWSLDYRFKQVGDAALDAFRMMPDRANLPVIAAIWKEYSTHPSEGNSLSPLDVTRTLVTHRFTETVPLLAAFLNNPNGDVASEAHSFLVEIVGQDLGKEPQAWANAVIQVR